MQSSDWKSVSQHYINEVVHRAIDVQKIDTVFQPTLLISACEDALAISRIVRAELKARTGQQVPVLNHQLQVYDDSNPYNVHTKPYSGSFSSERVLIVDKADNTRASITSFINSLREGAIASGQAQAAAAAQQWDAPKIAVFVLHNKRRSKTADLPEGVQEFVGEEVENVHIAYATSGAAQHEDQPQAHHSHPSGTLKPVHSKPLEHPGRKGSLTPSALPGSGHTSPPSDILRSLSSHYVETILEKAVEEQKLQERFKPTMLVAASDGALAPARLLRHYLRHRTGNPQRPTSDQEVPPRSSTPDIHDLPVLTPRLELYDEDLNPYLAHIHGVKAWGPASMAGQHVLVVDRVDETRTTLSHFINQLQQLAVTAKAQTEAEGRPWAGDPVFGVFVLHNKKVEKAADLPSEILADRYFYGAESEPVTMLYPFNVSTTRPLAGEISLFPQA